MLQKGKNFIRRIVGKTEEIRLPDKRYLATPVSVLKPVSVLIPAYEMYGKGASFLEKSLDMLQQQSFQNFEVLVSDQSVDDSIQRCCEAYAGKLKVSYVRKPERGNSCSNVNFALDHARYDIIKILFLDDVLTDSNALERTCKYFHWSKAKWMISACNHEEIETGRIYHNRFPEPFLDEHLFSAFNPLGCPSVLMFSKNDLRFDLQLPALMDIDFYFRLMKKYGPPTLFNDINVTIGVHPGMVTNNGGAGNREQVNLELAIVHQKYDRPLKAAGNIS
ncbi:MAG: glycosyltransferase family 2 protein [Bacteroidia bacterium]|nr:glycosyltransferase family 2 protein [Bacteroidia bacterium]MCC6768540.1 glycosyltransferase family 2 protein [Bacteroidia bacterium]